MVDRLYFLSFRDLTRKRAGPVLPAQVFYIEGVSNAYDWTSPKFWNRFKLGDIHTVPELQWPNIFHGKHVRFLIHGFNVNRDHGFMGSGALAQEMTPNGLYNLQPSLGPDDLFISVLWPGDWYIPGINYSFEFGDARTAGGYFSKFLTHPAFRIDRASFITHSFGVRIALETMRQTLARPDAALAPDFTMTMFMAAADDNDVFDRSEYKSVIEDLDSISVLSSENDKVLKFIFPFGDAAEAALWKNQETFHGALGCKGPKLKPESLACPKTSWRPIPDADKIDHGDYMPWPWTQDRSDVSRNGWTQKREKVLKLVHSLSNGTQQHPWPPIQKASKCP